MTVDLRKERLDRGFSIRGLSKEIGVPQHTISRAEAGLPITPGNAFKIATFFGYKVTDIWSVESFTGQAA